MASTTDDEPTVTGPVPLSLPFNDAVGGDVVLASPPKFGTTWLKALAFASMARAAHPAAGHPEHPPLRLNPHDCVPFMEKLFAAGLGSKMDALPSPTLMATHMHHSRLPASIRGNPDCKIIYICRDPKDMLVSMWHFARRTLPGLPFLDVFKLACNGRSLSGPIWDHILASEVCMRHVKIIVGHTACLAAGMCIVDL